MEWIILPSIEPSCKFNQKPFVVIFVYQGEQKNFE